MWKIFTIFVLYFPLSEPQFEFPELPELPEFPDFEFPDFDFPFDFSDFEFPCSCKNSHCECCIDLSIIDQKGKTNINVILFYFSNIFLFYLGCLRVTYKNNRIRVSAVYNDVDLGGFSTALPIPANTGVTLQIPCIPRASLQLRARNRRSRKNRRRFCIDAKARGPRRVLFNRDFCFDVNGNALTTINSS